MFHCRQACTHTHIHTHTHRQSHTYSHTQTITHIQPHTHVHSHSQSHSHSPTQTHIQICSCMLLLSTNVHLVVTDDGTSVYMLDMQDQKHIHNMTQTLEDGVRIGQRAQNNNRVTTTTTTQQVSVRKMKFSVNEISIASNRSPTTAIFQRIRIWWCGSVAHLLYVIFCLALTIFVNFL